MKAGNAKPGAVIPGDISEDLLIMASKNK